MIEKVLNHIKESKVVHKDIMKLIGYDSYNNSPVEKNDSPWGIGSGKYSDNLRIFTDGNCDDYYDYTISSYSAKGEQLFMGESGGYYVVMAHPSGESYSNTTIFVLNERNKVTLDF
jgi:hypothetical protein